MKIAMLSLVIISIIIIAPVRGYELYFFHNDNLGSPRTITDEHKNIVWRSDYKPFGKMFDMYGMCDLAFNAKEMDGTGFYYYGARYYDPDTGRFITPDIIEYFPNPYVYTGNNPLIYTDMDGHQKKIKVPGHKDYSFKPHAPHTRGSPAHVHVYRNEKEIGYISIVEKLLIYDKEEKRMILNHDILRRAEKLEDIITERKHHNKISKVPKSVFRAIVRYDWKRIVELSSMEDRNIIRAISEKIHEFLPRIGGVAGLIGDAYMIKRAYENPDEYLKDVEKRINEKGIMGILNRISIIIFEMPAYNTAIWRKYGNLYSMYGA